MRRISTLRCCRGWVFKVLPLISKIAVQEAATSEEWDESWSEYLEEEAWAGVLEVLSFISILCRQRSRRRMSWMNFTPRHDSGF